MTASPQPTDGREALLAVAQAICKSRTCEGISCCQWPAQRGRTECPVKAGAYDDAARAALGQMVRGEPPVHQPTSPSVDGERRAHKVMTAFEYISTPIVGWHEVCRNVDGFEGVGVRYLGEAALTTKV